jgi:hypothetical protein
MMMKTPVVLVTVALTAAILLAMTFLIVTGTRGDDALWPLSGRSSGRMLLTTPDMK